MSQLLTGRCHCGEVTVRFETASAPETMQLRACGCTFCRKHGARTMSDPAGTLAFHGAHDAAIRRYRFGTRTADFLLCAACGTFLGATMTIEGAPFGVLNANVLDDQRPFDRPSEVMRYDDASVDDRLARRRAKWTPLRG